MNTHQIEEHAIDWSDFVASKLDTIIDGEYRLLEVLGHGSYGCLFLGQHIRSGEYVAVKVLTKVGLDSNQLALQRSEIDIQSSLSHPNIISLHRSIEDSSHIYIIMELCDQGDLFDYVVRDSEINAVRDAKFVRKAFSEILDAVQYLHDNQVYHRDIKLENILLKLTNEDSPEEELVTKVADFGLATRDRLSMEFGCGSTTYLAPEHFLGDDQTDEELEQPYDSAASDVWSLGVMFLALVFGRNPWQEASSYDNVFAEYMRNPAVLKELFPMSEECFQFAKTALAIDPKRRPNIAELRQQFAKVSCFSNLPSETPILVSTPAVPIPRKQVNNVHSYDSGICVSGSWSDLADEPDHCDYDVDPFANDAMRYDDDNEETMFAHNEESWWL
ncbi:cAMP-dependent protein kinase catalytic subunit [Umbelopsis nana]